MSARRSLGRGCSAQRPASACPPARCSLGPTPRPKPQPQAPVVPSQAGLQRTWRRARLVHYVTRTLPCTSPASSLPHGTFHNPQQPGLNQRECLGTRDLHQIPTVFLSRTRLGKRIGLGFSGPHIQLQPGSLDLATRANTILIPFVEARRSYLASLLRMLFRMRLTATRQIEYCQHRARFHHKIQSG
ncbi:hypothetical protein PAAG_07083 [Paracoccidioides lutzii Pb01]|uniref:Uncharacterized protein n=1 Tax=Paracoccidioides lutzii (strain ATCC MYA-826 / Pb01) TaxID=502779 RepID=C1H8A6_PARBA|nr:hypothetical protein PAAG_07083 [Paracoccidioides lutzii Pb01]EEH36665.2 hypothetical protein PAAG_07083 [Paracoccidioides lutzii Pb01]